MSSFRRLNLVIVTGAALTLDLQWPGCFSHCEAFSHPNVRSRSDGVTPFTGELHHYQKHFLITMPTVINLCQPGHSTTGPPCCLPWDLSKSSFQNRHCNQLGTSMIEWGCIASGKGCAFTEYLEHYLPLIPDTFLRHMPLQLFFVRVCCSFPWNFSHLLQTST